MESSPKKSSQSPVKQRLVEFIKCKKISVRAFERVCEFPQGYVNTLISAPKPEKLEVIKKNYPELSIQWLMVGEGEMLAKDPKGLVIPTEVWKKFQQLTDTICSQQNSIADLTEMLKKKI